MKFGEYLLQNRIAQFSAWYIDYELLKQDISYAKNLMKQINALCSLQGIEFSFKLDEDAPFDFQIVKGKLNVPGKPIIRFETTMDRDFDTEGVDLAQTRSNTTLPNFDIAAEQETNGHDGEHSTNTDGVTRSGQFELNNDDARARSGSTGAGGGGGTSDNGDANSDRGSDRGVQFVGIGSLDADQQRKSDRNVAGFCNVREDPSTLGRGWQRAMKISGGGASIALSRRQSTVSMAFTPGPAGMGGNAMSRAEFEPYANYELTSAGDLTPQSARTLLQEFLAANNDPMTPKTVKLSPSITPRAGSDSETVSKKTVRIFPGVSSECKLQLEIQVPKEAFQECGLSVSHAHLALYLFQHQINDRFRHNWLDQITKVETFYNRESQLLSTAVAACIDTVKKFKDMKDDERNQLRTAFRQMLHLLDSLQQFCDLNEQAVAKILKKFDKVTKQDSLRAYRRVFPLFSFAIGHPNRIQLLKDDMIAAYTRYITNGDKKKAVEHLFLKDKAQQLNDRIPQASMASAMFTFTVLLSLLAIAELANLPQPLKIENGHNSSYIIGTTGVLLILPILFSFNVHLWSNYNINYQFMFEIDVDAKWDPLVVLRGALAYAMIWAGCTYAFARSATSELACEESGVLNNHSAIPAWLWPYLIVPGWLLWLFVRRLFRNRKRQHMHEWFFRTMLRCLATPFLTVRFGDFFLADQLTSLGGILFEMQFFWCVFQSSSLTDSCSDGRGKGVFAAAMVPNIWRFMQCINRYREADEENRVFFPHGVNACKYLSSIVAQLGGFFLAMSKFYATDDDNHQLVQGALGLYMILKIFSTIYKCFWDIMVDFAVIRVGTFEFRKERVYGPGWIYVGVCILDVVLRFAWLVGFGVKMHVHAEWVPFFFAAIEVIRRAIWNCFRVENEQVNNIESYRTTLLAPLPSRHVDESFYTGNAADIQKRFSTAPNEKVERGIRATNWSTITRFFACLPEDEKVRMLRRALPRQHFENKQYSGKSKMFSELPEEIKVHAVLEHIGEQTMGEYAAQFGTPASTAVPDPPFGTDDSPILSTEAPTDAQETTTTTKPEKEKDDAKTASLTPGFSAFGTEMKSDDDNDMEMREKEKSEGS